MHIPPPCLPDEFPVKVQLATVELPAWLYTPPPRVLASLAVNVQWVTTGVPLSLYIPPPKPYAFDTTFPVNVHRVTVGLVPTRYAGSEAGEDPAIQMARKTEWVEVAGDFCTGLGQRMFATDAGEYPLLETRTIAFDVPQEQEADDG